MTDWTPEQRDALEREGRLLVSASAGSGKTTVMMERVARFLEEGGDIGRIIVMTFTELAASEMKEKLLKIMYERIRQGVNREHLLKNVKKLPLARISTIDSFCMGLYRTYFERLGLSPDVTLLENGEDEALFERAAADTLIAAMAGTEREISLLQRYTDSQRLDTLIGYMKELWWFSAAKPDPDAFLQEATSKADKILDFDLARIRKRAARLKEKAEELSQHTASTWEKGHAFITVLIAALERLTACVDYRDYLEAYQGSKLPDLPRDGKKDDYIAALKEELKAIRDSYKTLWKDDLLSNYDGFFEREAEAVTDAQTFADLTLNALKRYRALKEEENCVNFADLERTALRLLNDSEVLQEVRDGVDRVFVDEYQDTNGLQEAILNRLTGENLFLVGDVKQAIYRFRFAEPRLFLERRKLFGRGQEGSNIDLNSNFRSEPEILDFVNRVMSQVMSADFGGVDYRQEAQLVAGLKSTGVAETEIFFYEMPKKESYPADELYSVRDGMREDPPDPIEGEYIANTILRLLREGRVSEGGKLRPIRYSDIAILVRNRAIGDLTAVFDKYGIPYRADKEDSNETPEVRDTWNLIRVLDNAMQDIPLAAVMMAFWQFGEGDLMRLKCKEGFSYGALYAPPPAGLEERLNAFRTQLIRYRTRAAYLGVDEIVTEIMRETGYDARVAARGPQALGTLNAFLYSIRTHKYRRSLPDFILNAANTAAPAPLAEEGDVVRFMTIHGSKGLEFPVVFVAHTHQGYERNKITSSPWIADSEWGIAMQHCRNYEKTTTARYLAMADKREWEEKEEAVRLMYVAFTRARSKLFISGKGKKKRLGSPEEGASIVDWVLYACDNDKALRRYLVAEPVAYAPGERQAEPAPSPTFTVSLSGDYSHPGGVALANKYAVSALEKVERDDKTPIPAYLGAQKAEIGTAYHLIMEKLDFNRRTAQAIEVLKTQYAAVPEMTNVDAGLLLRALCHPIFDVAAAYPCRKEAPFMLFASGKEIAGADTDEDVLVQGIADLIIDTPDGAILVDYKVSGAPEAVLKERYERQISLYCRALTESGCAVKEAYLVVLNRALVIKMC